VDKVKQYSLNITNEPDCQFRVYELERLKILLHAITHCTESIHDDDPANQDENDIRRILGTLGFN
jgi:hypothetical protein